VLGCNIFKENFMSKLKTLNVLAGPGTCQLSELTKVDLDAQGASESKPAAEK
jgi:hypothetical protein